MKWKKLTKTFVYDSKLKKKLWSVDLYKNILALEGLKPDINEMVMHIIN